MKNFIRKVNKKIDNYYDKNWEIKEYKVLNDNFNTMFENQPEGVYYSNIVTENNDWVSRLIAFFSGKFSHSVLIYNTGEKTIKKLLNEKEFDRLIKKFKIYYGVDLVDAEDIIQNTKVFVLGSADSNGMNYFNFSQYQDRKQQIISTRFDLEKSRELLKFMMTKTNMDKVYDYLGLITYPLWRFIDDSRAWYCSEQVYDVLKIFGLKVAKKDNPSPTKIAKYSNKLNNQIYSNVNEKL